MSHRLMLTQTETHPILQANAAPVLDVLEAVHKDMQAAIQALRDLAVSGPEEQRRAAGELRALLERGTAGRASLSPVHSLATTAATG